MGLSTVLNVAWRLIWRFNRFFSRFRFRISNSVHVDCRDWKTRPERCLACELHAYLRPPIGFWDSCYFLTSQHCLFLRSCLPSDVHRRVDLHFTGPTLPYLPERRQAERAAASTIIAFNVKTTKLVPWLRLASCLLYILLEPFWWTMVVIMFIYIFRLSKSQVKAHLVTCNHERRRVGLISVWLFCLITSNHPR